MEVVGSDRDAGLGGAVTLEIHELERRILVQLV